MKKAVRDQTIIVKISADEKREIYRAAYLNGETMSNFIRRTLLERTGRKEKDGND